MLVPTVYWVDYYLPGCPGGIDAYAHLPVSLCQSNSNQSVSFRL